MLYTVSLPSSLDEFEGCQWVQLEKTLLLSTTANTVTTATQTHLELQETQNHLKFIWACQRPLSPSKLVISQFFFQPLARPPPPPTLGSGSSFRHTLGCALLHHDILLCDLLKILMIGTHSWHTESYCMSSLILISFTYWPLYSFILPVINCSKLAI